MGLTLLSPGNRVHEPLGGDVSRYWDDELSLVQQPAGQDDLDDCGDRFLASPVGLISLAQCISTLLTSVHRAQMLTACKV